MVRSAGDYSLGLSGAAFGAFDAAAWSRATSTMGDVWASRWLLGTAMAAVGLNTNLAVFRGVGLRPFFVGLAGALVVGLVARAKIGGQTGDVLGAVQQLGFVAAVAVLAA